MLRQCSCHVMLAVVCLVCSFIISLSRLVTDGREVILICDGKERNGMYRYTIHGFGFVRNRIRRTDDIVCVAMELQGEQKERNLSFHWSSWKLFFFGSYLIISSGPVVENFIYLHYIQVSYFCANEFQCFVYIHLCNNLDQRMIGKYSRLRFPQHVQIFTFLLLKHR